MRAGQPQVGADYRAQALRAKPERMDKDMIHKGEIWEYGSERVEWMYDLKKGDPIIVECMKINGEYKKRGTPIPYWMLTGNLMQADAPSHVRVIRDGKVVQEPEGVE